MSEINETEEQPKEKMVMAIYLVADGSLRLEGSAIQEKMLAYGLLETARDLIKDAHDKANQSRIVKPRGTFLDSIRRMK